MKVKDIMRKEFVSLRSDDRLPYILKVFEKNNISSAPVFEGEEFLGIIGLRDIVDFAIPQHFMLFQKEDHMPSVRKLKKVIAKDLTKRNKTILKPEQNLKTVIKRIMGAKVCIPVIDKKKVMVGLVRSEDLAGFLLEKFAKGEWLEPEAEIYNVRKGDRRVQTDIDRILGIVRKKEWTPVRKIAKELGMSVKTAEELGEILHEHRLVRVRYTFLGGAELGRIKKEKAKR